MTPECHECGTALDSAIVGSGGRVGWFCESCMRLYPEEGIDTNGRTVTTQP